MKRLPHLNKIIEKVRPPKQPDDPFPLIHWVYRWKDKNGKFNCKPSTALLELTEYFYFEN